MSLRNSRIALKARSAACAFSYRSGNIITSGGIPHAFAISIHVLFVISSYLQAFLTPLAERPVALATMNEFFLYFSIQRLKGVTLRRRNTCRATSEMRIRFFFFIVTLLFIRNYGEYLCQKYKVNALNVVKKLS